MRLTVIGRGPAEPQPDTPASGLLVESGQTSVLFDCGQGVIARLLRTRDPRALSGIVIGHMHADHYADLAALRYLLPWEGVRGGPRVFLPPGGHARLTSLAGSISERPTFFDEALTIAEYGPDSPLQVGELELDMIPGQHYVPSFGAVVTGPSGARLVLSGDTGPTDTLVRAAQGADVLVCEATLRSAEEDEQVRGHMTADEGLSIALAAKARSAVLTHYASRRRMDVLAACARVPMRALAADPGLSGEVVAGVGWVAAGSVGSGLVAAAASLPAI